MSKKREFMMKISIKLKLILFLLLVIIITGLISTIVGTHLIGDRIVKQAQKKVRLDLNTAREIYLEKIREVKTTVRLTALRYFIKNAFMQNDIKSLEANLKKISENENLDFLTLTDKDGKVVLRTHQFNFQGDDQARDELIKKVLKKKKEVAATQILSKEELIKESQNLADKAVIQLIQTPKARQRKEKQETSGMIIKAAAPILDYDGNLIGILYGGILLNRNYEIVDKIKDIVYRGETYKDKDIGTATIFQNGLRISTNVRDENGNRAIGTRVSEEVYNQVVLKGNPWIDRAFVVNDWYITAYEPIKNINNKIIGILYVGILEEEFTDMRNRTLWTFLGITFIGIIFSFIISYFLGNSIVKQIKYLVSASSTLASGNLDQHVEIQSKDEIGELASTFNLMAKSIKKRDRQLKEFTQKKIMESERLAIVGQLAAGVAHEINNPLGSILIYSNLLLEDIEEDNQTKENLQKIVEQTTKCKDIVRGLLDFSRETKTELQIYDIHLVIENVLSLVQNQSLFQNVQISKNFNPQIPEILFDKAKIQQVFLNILLNAVEAMNGKGELKIETDLALNKDFIEIRFSDSGCGISKEDIKRLFEPFFSAREDGHGTGLGLSISYGIIKKHKGNIKVKSQLRKGSTFTISLPVKEKNG